MKKSTVASTITLAQAINNFVSTDITQAAIAIHEVYVPLVQSSVLRWQVVRPKDLFVADFLLHNLKLTSDLPIRLVRKIASKNAYISMELQGQHFGEEVLIVGDIPPTPPADITGELRKGPPAAPHVMRARFAHPSRIVVRMPATLASIDFTLDKLLEVVTTWPLSLDPLARVPAYPADLMISPGLIATRQVDRSRLSLAVELLRSASIDLQAFLTEKGAEALGRLVYREAARSAILAVAAVRADQPGAGRLQETAARLVKRLSSERALDADTREALNALYEVALAEKTADQALKLGETDWTKLLEVSRLFLLWLMPHQPSDQVTALELPYRLITSPHANSTFTHPLDPQTLAGRTELWRTTLARRTEAGPEPLEPAGASLTVMWSPDYSVSGPVKKKDPFRMSLFPRHRDNLVRLMAGHLEQLTGGGSYIPKPATAHRLQLSAWGGVLELDGVWTILPHGFGVEAWSHDASYGRDERVRVVEAGYLFPYGHRGLAGYPHRAPGGASESNRLRRLPASAPVHSRA